MSNNEYVAPVNHGVLSATGNVAVGTVGGALKSTAKMIMWCVGGGAVLGVLAFTGLLPLGAIAGALGSTGAWSLVGNIVGGTVVGGLIGATIAAVASPIAAVFGAGKGVLNSAERVSQEKGAARMMEAQMAVYQAQAAAQGNGASKYNFPAQGSSMNPASARIQNDSVQNFGAMNAPELQRT